MLVKWTWLLLMLSTTMAKMVSGDMWTLLRTPIIQTQSGELRGAVSYGLSGRYYSYYGIPYALVKKRFQAAVPVTKWQGVFEATKRGIECMQREWFNILPTHGTNVIGQEDCLILNVYTPFKANELTEPLPVMVFIHGGGFREGSSMPNLYGPEYLINKDVILVTINYRVEVLGFLCLGIEDAPGNAGLKDQAEALKWVKKNIRAFGGDPDNVTIFGESAGSASVMYHLLSPMSKGLFKRGIMESGSPIAFWSLQFEPLKIASQLAKEMGFETKDPQELYEIFISKSAEELLKTRVPRPKSTLVQAENIFVPCIEKTIPNVEPFITEAPYNIISEGRYSNVPLIIGYNSVEGYYFAGKENDTTVANMNFYASLPRDLEFPSEDEAIKTAKILKQLYMGDQKISKATLVDYEGESGISYPVIATIDLLLKTSDEPIYSYKFSISGLLNLQKFRSGFPLSPGAAHVDDLFYIFKPKLTTPIGVFENDAIEKMTTMWTNFAKYGNPTPELTSLLPLKWRSTDKEDPRVFIIDRFFSTEPLWNSEKFAFWNETYSKYRRTQ
ncbi:esterase FE4-like [Pectinophora gossypiella]|uniref:esterase FE4-like n=1 Tax=Pectinophora gossypiella TaxID=13191 RepID=UPI00214E696F|nr:esterase FE4-like [Pectinophora gossypiella]XP_049875084.1 esterase FE4-like [Pectinophora gossypiella]